MPRSRSNSRPASRPSSRPGSMLSTALNLSPQILNLGDSLITKVTGFTEDEDNFDICHDFVVSNLLYHTYMEPHEKDVKKRFDKLIDKWNIQNKGEKSARIQELLGNFNNASVFEEGVEHEQHGIKTRLLVLLLSLSNSDEIKVIDDNSDGDQDIQMLLKDIVQESEASKNARKAHQIRTLLAEGEEKCRHFYSDEDSELSEWSDEEEIQTFISFPQIDDPKPFLPKFEKKPVTHLPGVKQPLKPPETISDFENCDLPLSAEAAQAWISENLMPPYWIETTDSKGLRPTVEVSNPMPDAHFVNFIENHFLSQGHPVEEKLILPEYQVLYECIWLLRNPTSNQNPLLRWNCQNQSFQTNPQVCLSSLMPITLASSFNKFVNTLNDLRQLHEFVGITLDRRQDPGGIQDDQKPPFTYEAYAEALTNVFNLLSADLLSIEKIIKGRQETYTLLSFFRDISPWSKIIQSLGKFHQSAVTNQIMLSNWEKAFHLLVSLGQALNTCLDSRLHSILADLILKSMSPYFRIIGVWLTQGRFEDYRSEFVYGIKESLISCQTSILDDDSEEEYLPISHLSAPSEKFWTDGFIERPFVEYAEEKKLSIKHVPFAEALSSILTCGKSITILTILEKQSVLFPGYKSAFTPIQDIVAPTELYDNFLSNLRKNLVIHKRKTVHEKKFKPNIPLVVEGLSLQDLIGDVSEYDSDLVAAYDIIAADLPQVVFSNQDEENIVEEQVDEAEEEDENYLVDPDRFLILSDYGLDPIKSITSAMEEAFQPVIYIHTDRACSRLVYLFKHSLDLSKHFMYLRQIFFMEAGDLLSEFYTPMFSKIEEKVDFDSTSLNILLHDSLCRRFPSEEVEKFHVEIDTSAKNPLDSVYMSYDVSWPMNIILHTESLKMYNKVFIFLLRVKQALWALLKIDANELVQTLDRPVEGLGDDSEIIEETMEEKELKLHRIILLRSWLLHFISNIHDYFMTRVVQSTQIDLDLSLMECNDLDSILNVHNRYISKIYDRCFLHSSASVLKDAVFKILKSAMVLYKYCTKHVADPEKIFILETNVLKSMEENYAKRHQFLAKTLKAMTEKHNVPHLDGLVAALLHSCPTVVF